MTIEPVAWMSDDGRPFKTESEARRHSWNSASPLYDERALVALNLEAEEQSRLIERQAAELAEIHALAFRLGTERDALRQRIESAPVVQCQKVRVAEGHATQTAVLEYTHERIPGGANSWIGKRVRLVVDDM